MKVGLHDFSNTAVKSKTTAKSSVLTGKLFGFGCFLKLIFKIVKAAIQTLC